jgi:hypothetical protein
MEIANLAIALQHIFFTSQFCSNLQLYSTVLRTSSGVFFRPSIFDLQHLLCEEVLIGSERNISLFRIAAHLLDCCAFRSQIRAYANFKPAHNFGMIRIAASLRDSRCFSLALRVAFCRNLQLYSTVLRTSSGVLHLGLDFRPLTSSVRRGVGRMHSPASRLEVVRPLHSEAAGNGNSGSTNHNGTALCRRSRSDSFRHTNRHFGRTFSLTWQHLITCMHAQDSFTF